MHILQLLSYTQFGMVEIPKGVTPWLLLLTSTPNACASD